MELWPLDRLKPYDRNPKKHSPQRVNEMAMLIVEFGFTDPIQVSSAAGIVAGHRRLLAARRLNLPRVPVINLDHLTPEQARAFRLAHNRSSEGGEYEAGLLVGELEQAAKDGFSSSMLGYTDEDIAALERDLEDLAEAPVRGARAGKILCMIEFDNEAQKERWVGFTAWLRHRADGASFASALTEFVTKAMETRGRKS